MKNNFNIIITGVGGQGIITLLSVINEAAFIEGYDVKSSELHGLSQRGGSVIAHIRFGKKVYSPMVSQGEADLIIGLEMLEVLRSFIFTSDKTMFLINRYSLPFIGTLPEKEILEGIKKVSGDNLSLVPASEICKKELGKEVVSGIYLLGCAAYKNLIPLKPESFLKAAENIIPKKHLELNKKAFNLAKNA